MFVDQVRTWQSLVAKTLNGLHLQVDPDRECQVILFGKLSDQFGRVTGVDRYQGEILMAVFILVSLQGRHLSAAGRAPGSPIIYQDGLTQKSIK